MHVILGVNGAGKSTLIKLLNRLLKPRAGVIVLYGENLASLSLNEIARRVGYISQQNQSCDLTVTDYLLLGRKPHVRWNLSAVDEEIVFEILERLHLEALALRPLAQLSGGELQKTIIARALVQKPEILLLDEPTSNLDLKNQLEVMKIISQETDNHKLTTIIAMHDVNLALRFASSFTLMKEKKILAAGGVEVMTQENLAALYGLRVRLHNLGDSLIVVPE